MNRRQFLKYVGGLTLGGGMAASQFKPFHMGVEAVEAQKPNLLFVFADQMRASAMGCMGNGVVQTPNLDILASEGVLSTHGYSCSPLCSPDRACLLTGLYPHTHGVVMNNIKLHTDIPTIADVLKLHGFATGYIDKWHLDGTGKPGFVPPGEQRQGFDFWAAFNRGHKYMNSTYYRDENRPINEKQFEPDYQMDIAIDFIRNFGRESDRPFCLYIPWGPPHTPYEVPAKYLDIYRGKQMPIRPNVPAGSLARAKKEIPSYYALIHLWITIWVD